MTKTIPLVTCFVMLLGGANGCRPLFEPLSVRHDERIGRLTRFMGQHHFATPYYADEYIRAADAHRLDYTIVPVIAALESSGCVHLVKNNCFGWASAKTGFRSIPEGIHFVTKQLASGRYYKGKTLEQKIRTYNSVNSAYWNNFQRLQKEIR